MATGSRQQRRVLFKRPVWVVAALILLAVVAPAIGSPAAEGDDEANSLTVAPRRFAFHVVAGQPNPAAQALQITSSGDPLLWTAEYEASWLALDALRGSTPADLRLQIDATGFDVGHYETSVRFQPGFELPISLDVYAPTAAPEFVVEPVALSFEAVAGEPAPASQALMLRTLAEGTAEEWSAVTSASWLRLSGYSGTAPASIAVEVDHSALSPGEHIGTLWVGGQTVEVLLEVAESQAAPESAALPETTLPANEAAIPAGSEQAMMSFAPAELSFAAIQSGAAPERKDLEIAAADGSAQPWEATADVPWLLLNSASGTTPEMIKVEVAANQLAPGEHAGTLTINGEAVTVRVEVLPRVEANAAFLTLAARHDEPVRTTQVGRTWLWGPQPLGAVNEPYAEAPNGTRVVQYYDKARMEITDPAADPASIWYVTNGRLAWELITGKLQTGDNTFTAATPAELPVAGDADDMLGPTYAAFAELLNAPPVAAGTPVTQTVTRHGHVGMDEALAAHGVTIGYVEPVTKHGVASVFWDYLQSSGQIWDGGTLVEGRLFEPWHFVTGLPITEPYWARVKVGGEVQDILIQCFERRCLTFTPSNTPEWRVEQGNVGLHYFRWRYE